MLKNYEPLFLKYRPQKLDELVGQESVKETLKNAILNNKLVHAYLFTGPRGTGKTSSARIFAKSLNCRAASEGPTVDPCGVCPSCASIADSTSLDVVEIDAASHGHVEDARSLIEKVNLASMSGAYKIYIIDEVHMLSTAAFNALLKIFEEPPENVVFILATTEEDKVLPTIVSRCQKFNFKHIAMGDSVSRLRFVADSEKINIDEEALTLIAKRSDGGMRDALSILDQLSVFSDAINAEKVIDLLGGVSLEDLVALNELLSAKDSKGLLTKLDELLLSGKEAIPVLKEFSNFLLEKLESGDHAYENSELVQIIDALADLEFRMRQSTQSKNLLRAQLLKLCHRDEILVVKDILKRLEALESGAPRTKAVQIPVYAEVPAPKPKAESVSKNHQEQVLQSDEKQAVDSGISVKAKPVSSGHDDFVDYLPPASKGIFVSSRGALKEINSGEAILTIPEKFRFLQSKIEAKSEDFASAISKSSGETVNSIKVLLTNEEPVQEVKTPAKKPEAKFTPPIRQEPKAKPFVQAKNKYESAPAQEPVLERNPKLTGNHKLDEAVKTAVDTFAGKVL